MLDEFCRSNKSNKEYNSTGSANEYDGILVKETGSCSNTLMRENKLIRQ